MTLDSTYRPLTPIHRLNSLFPSFAFETLSLGRGSLRIRPGGLSLLSMFYCTFVIFVQLGSEDKLRSLDNPFVVQIVVFVV